MKERKRGFAVLCLALKSLGQKCAFHTQTWVEIDICCDAGSDECNSEWAAHGGLVVKHLELVHVRVAKKLPSYCAFVSGKRRKKMYWFAASLEWHGRGGCGRGVSSVVSQHQGCRWDPGSRCVELPCFSLCLREFSSFPSKSKNNDVRQFGNPDLSLVVRVSV